MQKELIDQWSQLSRKTVDSLRELGEINARLVEQISRQQLNMLNASIEASARGTQLVSQAQGYGQLIDNQATLAADYNKKVLNIVRQTADVLTEARDDLTAWVERGVQNVERGVEVAGRTVEQSVQWGADQAEEGAERVRKTAQSATKRAAKSTNGAKRATAKQSTAKQSA